MRLVTLAGRAPATKLPAVSSHLRISCKSIHRPEAQQPDISMQAASRMATKDGEDLQRQM